MKRGIPQAVFESKEARQAIKAGHAQACRELDAKFDAGGPFDESDPNHPMYELHIFGYHHKEFMARQHKEPK